MENIVIEQVAVEEVPIQGILTGMQNLLGVVVKALRTLYFTEDMVEFANMTSLLTMQRVNVEREIVEKHEFTTFVRKIQAMYLKSLGLVDDVIEKICDPHMELDNHFLQFLDSTIAAAEEVLTLERSTLLVYLFFETFTGSVGNDPPVATFANVMASTTNLRCALNHRGLQVLIDTWWTYVNDRNGEDNLDVKILETIKYEFSGSNLLRNIYFRDPEVKHYIRNMIGC